MIKRTLEEKILDLKKIHKNKYIYSLLDNVSYYKKLRIICPEHGIFEQDLSSHIKGYGCPKCSKNKTITTIEFIERSKKIHGDKYDYSLVEYVNNYTKIKIICPKHGVFEQKPGNHLISRGCTSCGKMDFEKFKIRCKEIHNDKYDYSLVNYIDYHTKVKIICPKHGIFDQSPIDHWGQRGCPICNESKGEQLISKILSDRNICFERQKKFPTCKNKKNLPFDFYLPEKNICIEYNGEQHYKPNQHFGGIKTFENIQMNDNIKINFCKFNKIELLIIKFDENVLDRMNIF
jgi:hypothetical protein